MGWYGLDSSGSGKGPVTGSCEHSNEPSFSITYGESLELNDWQFLKKHSAPKSQLVGQLVNCLVSYYTVIRTCPPSAAEKSTFGLHHTGQLNDTDQEMHIMRQRIHGRFSICRAVTYVHIYCWSTFNVMLQCRHVPVTWLLLSNRDEKCLVSMLRHSTSSETRSLLIGLQ
jgi:hypothetical protein